MISFLRSWILNITTVIVFVTILELLLPNSAMKKYIKMIVGLLVMLVILNPILELINGKANVEYEILKTSAYMDNGPVTTSIDRVEEIQNKQMIHLYKEKLERHIKDRIEFSNNVKVISIDSEIEKNKQSKDFGNITKLKLVISNSSQKHFNEEGVQPVANVEVDISKQETTSDGTKLGSKDEHIMNEMKSNIADFLNLDETKIDISVYQ
ncbi:stage III sporulation protein AF [Clostridiaceae bacterium 35-E11]